MSGAKVSKESQRSDNKRMVSIRISNEKIDQMKKIKDFMNKKEGNDNHTIYKFIEEAVEIYVDSYLDYYPELG